MLGSRRIPSPTFWTLFSHPSHLLFLSTNIGLLIHLRCYSMFRSNVNQEFDDEEELSDEQAQSQLQQDQHVYTHFDDKIVNDKRKARTINNFPHNIEGVRESKQIADNFLQHRSKIVSIFQDNPDNIDALFQDHHHYYSDVNANDGDNEISSITSYGQIPQHLQIENLIYNDIDIKSSLLLLSTSLVNAVLVELNLDKLLLQQGDESMIIDDKIINEIKDPFKQQSILKILSTIYDKDVYGTPKSFKDFFANLDKEEVTKFLSQLKVSDSFNSIETYRKNFLYFKSSQFLNYNDNNDNIKFMESRTNSIKFYNNDINNDEYIKKFDNQFDHYSGDRNHLNLALGISSHLITCSKHIPNYQIFKYLLDKFDTLKLHNYESLVYKSLFQFKHQSLVLSSSSSPSMVALHFQHLLQSNASILSSLIKYQVNRRELTTFKQLLSFLNFKDISHFERLLNQTKFQPLISKSMYYKTNLNLKELNNNIAFPKPLYLLPQDIYDIMNSCIEFKQFQYLDSLFNKLIIHSINDESHKITLNPDDSNKDFLLLNSTLSIEEIHSKMFNDKLFEILIRSSRLSSDLGRLMWILPHLDQFLNDYVKRQPMLNNPALIKEIYLSLKQFGIEGKIYSYHELLNFKQFE
ncbi:hypothetical protein DFJ63DRAFT_337045 [Scheffersomyces coipomensis]|uniref:uncharacterized protein n=1 Tax=Scheffersomyces coipomensis TaxID=1788519 RepID=UPI00315D3076